VAQRWLSATLLLATCVAGCERRAAPDPGRELLELAQEHRRRGDLAASAAALEQRALKLEAAHDRARLADNAYRLFYVQWEAGQYRPALEAALAAYRDAEATRQPRLAGSAALGLFSLLVALGDPAGALRALELAEQHLEPEDGAGQAHLRANRGVVLLEQRRYALAEQSLRQALELAQGLEPRFYRSVQLNLAETLLAQGEIEAARAAVLAAAEHASEEAGARTAVLFWRARVALAEGRVDLAQNDLEAALAEAPADDWRWELELALAEVARSQGRRAAEAAALERAVGAIEALRGELGLEELKVSLLERKREPFERLFTLAARAGRAAEAVAWADRAMARAWADAFVVSTAAAAPAADLALWQPGAVVDRFDLLAAVLPRMLAPAAAGTEARPVPAVPGRGLAFFQAEDRVWALGLGDGRPRLRELPLARSELLAKVDRFAADPDDLALGAELGALLLVPELLPAVGEPLAIVADGPLARLPFAALRFDGRFLAERQALSLAPSLDRVGRPAVRRPSSVVVLADPGSDLPAARAEAALLGALPGARTYVGAEADRKALRLAAGADLLHVAAHSGVDTRGPWLRLADGEIAPAELVAARVAPRFVVLASCGSARSARGGVWGSLGGAFLAAGSEQALVTLRSVGDEAVYELVRNFYALGAPSDPAQALARVQRAAIVAQRPARDWSALVVLRQRPAVGP
jgi:tetratricopeptide (TPR) repeat protein